MLYNFGHRDVHERFMYVGSGNTKGESITVPITSSLTGLEPAVSQLTIFVFICKTDNSKPVKQEVNGTVILPPLVFPGWRLVNKYTCHSVSHLP